MTRFVQKTLVAALAASFAIGAIAQEPAKADAAKGAAAPAAPAIKIDKKK